MIIVIAFVAAIIIAFGREKSSTAINFASNLVAGEKVSIPENKNWQAELGTIATDIEPVDTEASTPEKETVTDVVSRTFISNYLSMKQGDNLDASSAQSLIDKTDQFLSQSGLKPLTASDFMIKADGDKSVIEAYGNALGNALRDNKTSKIKNELEIFKAAVEANDPKKIEELDEIAAVYERIATNLLKVPIPKKFTKAHVDITNGIRGVSLALKDLKSLFTDPVLGLAGMNKYKDSATQYFQARQATAQYILLNGIKYKQGSGGYYLIYGI